MSKPIKFLSLALVFLVTACFVMVQAYVLVAIGAVAFVAVCFVPRVDKNETPEARRIRHLNANLIGIGVILLMLLIVAAVSCSMAAR